MWSPCLLKASSPAGDVSVRVGHPLIDVSTRTQPRPGGAVVDAEVGPTRRGTRPDKKRPFRVVRWIRRRVRSSHAGGFRS